MTSKHQKLPPLLLNPSPESKNNSCLVPSSENTVQQSPKSPKKKRSRIQLETRDKIEILSVRKRLQIFLSWRAFEFFIFMLIIVYMLLVFATFAIDDPSLSQSIDNVDRISFVLKIIEIVILAIFCFEISLKIIAFGFMKYFSDKWLIFDAIVILLSLVLVIIDLTIENKTFSSISKVFRVLFRFLRLFLLFRKVSQFKRINRFYSHFDVKSPVEKCLEILMDARKEIDDNLMLKDIEWCMEMISSNKLYDPLMMFNKSIEKDEQMGQMKQTDVVTWLEQYQFTKGRVVHQNGDKISGSLLVPAGDSKSRRNSAMGRSPTMNNISSINIVSVPNDIAEKLEKCDEFGFDCFEFHRFAAGHGISYLIPHLFNAYGLIETGKFDETKLFAFSKKIESGYLNNPYHNKIHGFDVCQTVNVFISKCKFGILANLNHLEIAAMLLAGAVHDYEHPGFNNMYLINVRDPYALRYNDKSVLENHHIAASWLVTLSDEKLNVFEKLDRDEYRKIREWMISMVLATDMSFHFSDLAKLKEKDKHSCMDSLIHASDISNPAKPFNIYAEWTDRILKEYWNQGDNERSRGLAVSYLMDRYTVNTAKSQVGFINVIVQPLFEVLKSFLPEIQVCIKALDENKELWNAKTAFYDEELKKLNDEKNKEKNP